MNDTPACAHCKVVLKHAQHKVKLPGHTYESTLLSDYWECADGCGKRFYPAGSSGLLAMALRLNDGHEWPISRAIREFYSIQAVTIGTPSNSEDTLGKYIEPEPSTPSNHETT